MFIIYSNLLCLFSFVKSFCQGPSATYPNLIMWHHTQVCPLSFLLNCFETMKWSFGRGFRCHTFTSWAAVTQQGRSHRKARRFICCSAKVDYGSLRPAAVGYWTAQPPTVITALVQKANAEEHSSGAQHLHRLSSQGTGRATIEKQTAKGLK